MGQGAEGLWIDHSETGGASECASDHRDFVASIELAARGGIEHGPGIEDRDALHGGIAMGVDERETSAGDRVKCIRLGGGIEERCTDHRGHIGLHGLDDSGEQVVLVGEVVIQGAFGHAGEPNDLLDGRGRVPIGSEQDAGGAVTADEIYCVYIASNEDIVLEHARCGGFPANSVSAVNAIIDPTTGE